MVKTTIVEKAPNLLVVQLNIELQLCGMITSVQVRVNDEESSACCISCMLFPYVAIVAHNFC